MKTPAFDLADALARSVPDMPEAACKGSVMADTAWFPLVGTGTHHAKKICRECPELLICRNWILAFEERQGRIEQGIWGGYDEAQRAKRLKTKRRKSRAA